MTRFAAATSSGQTLHAALGPGKNSWLLATRFPDRDSPSRYPLPGGHADGLMTKLDAARDRLAKVSCRAPNVTLCYEAGCDGLWLARFLERRGIAATILHAIS